MGVRGKPGLEVEILEKQIMYSTPRGNTDKLEEPVNRELNVTS